MYHKTEKFMAAILMIENTIDFFDLQMLLWCLAGGAGDGPDLQSSRALALPRLQLPEPAANGLLLIQQPQHTLREVQVSEMQLPGDTASVLN